MTTIGHNGALRVISVTHALRICNLSKKWTAVSNKDIKGILITKISFLPPRLPFAANIFLLKLDASPSTSLGLSVSFFA